MGIVTGIEHAAIARLFLIAFLLGTASGAFYDVFRILRRATKPFDRSIVGIAVIFIEDIVFFIVLAAVYSIFFYQFNSGRIRLSGIFAAAVGFSAYYFSVGKAVMLAADCIISLIRKLLNAILSLILLILSPFKRLCDFIIKTVILGYAAESIRTLSLAIYTKRTMRRYGKILRK